MVSGRLLEAWSLPDEMTQENGGDSRVRWDQTVGEAPPAEIGAPWAGGLEEKSMLSSSLPLPLCPLDPLYMLLTVSLPHCDPAEPLGRCGHSI